MRRKLRFIDFSMFVEAWCLLALARVMLVLMPFKKILPFIKYKNQQKSSTDNVIETLQRIQLSITRASIRSPWRTKCFEQALAAKMMTRRRGIDTVVYFGVKKEVDGKNLEAHAWIKCGDFIVTGWQQLNTYTVVGKF